MRMQRQLTRRDVHDIGHIRRIVDHRAACLAIVFNALNQFAVPDATLASYFTLAVAVWGVGGVYTCCYSIIGLVVPPE